MISVTCPHCGHHFHPHPPAGAPPAPGFPDVMAALHRIENLMTQTATAEAALAASVAKLQTDLSAKLQTISTTLQTLASNTSDADTATALASLQADVDAMDGQVNGFDPSAPPAAEQAAS